MREIKFRGLGYDNKWYYGYYYVIGDLHYIQTAIESVSVNPFSISQFTGLYDRNGEEIYEGDIVLQLTHNGKKRMRVDFNFGCFYAGFHNGSSTKKRPKLLSKIVEVIGNIYENHELLK